MPITNSPSLPPTEAKRRLRVVERKQPVGYDVHITRAPDWAQNEGMEIPAEEWRAVIEADPHLAPDPENGPNAALWTAHPEARGDAWFDWSQGNVYSTNPDDALIEKMSAIAAQLNAHVQGDDGKVYAMGEETEHST